MYGSSICRLAAVTGGKHHRCDPQTNAHPLSLQQCWVSQEGRVPVEHSPLYRFGEFVVRSSGNLIDGNSLKKFDVWMKITCPSSDSLMSFSMPPAYA